MLCTFRHMGHEQVAYTRPLPLHRLCSHQASLPSPQLRPHSSTPSFYSASKCCPRSSLFLALFFVRSRLPSELAAPPSLVYPTIHTSPDSARSKLRRDFNKKNISADLTTTLPPTPPGMGKSRSLITQVFCTRQSFSAPLPAVAIRLCRSRLFHINVYSPFPSRASVYSSP